MVAIGLDIGTTTICALVIDSRSGDVLKSVTLPNDSQINGKPFERLQNPEAILNTCKALVESLVSEFAPVSCIGISGQMHGIVYLDKNGNSASPLYTWQDMSANLPFGESQSYAARLSELSSYKAATGFGAATYFYHNEKRLVEKDAVCFCTIHDYVALRLTGKTAPLVHASNAASFSLFDLASMSFDISAVEKSGLSYSFFPQTTADAAVLGEYSGIPVAVAIGDNQASFIGSVNNFKDCLLINIGTGSQISFATNILEEAEGTELRPCFEGQMLRVGSSLCGGRAFAILEKFLAASASLVTDKNVSSAYQAIDNYLASNGEPPEPLLVSTKFSGTREAPEERGFIQNIGIENFTPGHLIWGVLHGIVDELAQMYLNAKGSGHKFLIGSGNGLRKNPALQKLFSKKFSLSLKIPFHNEEAAFGAALFALNASGIYSGIEKAQELIKYR